MRLKYLFQDKKIDLAPVRRGAEISLMIDDRLCVVSDYQTDGVLQRFIIDSREYCVHVARDGDNIFVHLDGDVWDVQAINPIDAAGTGSVGSDAVVAPMPGVVVSAPVKVGDQVISGQILIVIESMKLQTSILADRDGIIAEIFYCRDETFDKGSELMRFAAIQDDSADEVSK